MNWFEQLPDSCPPDDATSPKDETFYRIAKGNPVTSDDFVSQRKMNPHKLFAGIDECISLAVSVYKNFDDALITSKLPNFKNSSCIIQVILSEDDGLVKKTGKRSHYSWWRTIKFDFKKQVIIKQL
jgi:hypothetical protein